MITVINDQFSIIILLGIAGEDSTTEGLWCGVQGGLRVFTGHQKNLNGSCNPFGLNFHSEI